MNVRDVLKQYERAVAIVHYRPAGAGFTPYPGGAPVQNPAVCLQVSLLASKVSHSGQFIRLGDTHGDEIVGWTPMDSLEVLEILGELQADSKTVVPLEPK